MGLSTWNKPSLACLATRFPYNEKITLEKLQRVEKAERYLQSLGFRQLRVRSHGDIARIEVLPQEIPKLLKPSIRNRIVEGLKAMGYIYIALDLQGYITGSMNETLKGVKGSRK